MPSQHSSYATPTPLYDANALATMGTHHQPFGFPNPLNYLPNYANAMVHLHNAGYADPSYHHIPYEVASPPQQYGIDPHQAYLPRPNVIYQSSATVPSESPPSDIPELVRPRPLPTPSNDGSSNAPYSPTATTAKKPKEHVSCHAKSICTVCGTNNTTLWRRSQSGEVECNACNLYFRKNHKRRPHDLVNKPIVKRNRRKAIAYSTQFRKETPMC
uniref:GATA-type domain-containing protein n=1 Tax=Steinernema glaseri TaxID=37863 RepID=A0A1I8AA39_9BILA